MENPLDLVAHLGAEVRVEIGEGLVQKQQRRGRGQGAGHGHALLLAAGQLVGIAGLELAEADEPQDLAHPVAAGSSAHTLETDPTLSPTVRWGKSA